MFRRCRKGWGSRNSEDDLSQHAAASLVKSLEELFLASPITVSSMCWWMVLLYKPSKFRSNLETSASSAIKDGKHCKANVTHTKMNSRDAGDNMSVLQLYLDSGKARELKARDSQFQKIVWVKYFFCCLLVYSLFNWRGRGVRFGYQEPSKSQECQIQRKSV